MSRKSLWKPMLTLALASAVLVVPLYATAQDKTVDPKELGDVRLEMRTLELCQGGYIQPELKEKINLWINQAKAGMGLGPDEPITGEYSNACKAAFETAEKRAPHMSTEDCTKTRLALEYVLWEASQ